MTETLKSATRWSPRPREDYNKHGAGPGTSTFLRDAAAWNLAFLLHDYDKWPEHSNPLFTVAVMHSSRVRLADCSVSPLGTDPPEETVASWLLMPAPRFLYLMQKDERLALAMPVGRLFPSPGDWLRAAEQRVRLCQVPGPDNAIEVTDVSEAAALLQQIANKGR